MGGQDCDGSTLPQAPIGSRPIRSDGLPCPSPTDDDRQISSEDRRSVKLRVRPPPAGTHQCHRATSAGSGMMLTVKLTLQLAQSTDDEPVGCRKSANRNPIAENRLKPMPGSQALNDFIAGSSKRVYEGGRVDASQFKAARWDLLPQAGYLWASVQTVRGCSRTSPASLNRRRSRSATGWPRPIATPDGGPMVSPPPNVRN